MSKKYRFRQVFIICQDKQIIKSSQNKTTNYKNKSDADEQCENTIAEYRPYEMGIPYYKAPKFEVEGFYLVHESLYDELLKDVAKVTLKVVK